MSGRPHTPELERLRNQVWVHQLRLHPAMCDRCDAGAPPQTRGAWARLARVLFADLDHEELARGHLQALMGIVRKGTDPERVVRRFSVADLTPGGMASVEVLPAVQRIERRSSGPEGERGGKKRVAYLQASLNLVARGEAIAPGSADWFYSPLWSLAGPTLPRLEDLRLVLLQLKARLGLCNPSPQELAPHLDSSEQANLTTRSRDELINAYRASLTLLGDNISSDLISLLAGLVAETFITDQSDLHEIHCEVFASSMNRFLKPPLMAAIAKEFEIMVGGRILMGSWELPAAFHVSSLSAPFMKIATLDSMRKETFVHLPPPHS